MIIQEINSMLISCNFWPNGLGKSSTELDQMAEMNHRSETNAFQVSKHLWIDMSDGVSLSVDMRRSGDIKGHVLDIYSNDELTDACHLI